MSTMQEESRDKITGALRGDLFTEALKQELVAAEQNEKSLTVVLVDLDRFGQVNERHGREAGDQVLKMACEEISAISENTALFRHEGQNASVNQKQHPVYRYGGEEFTVLMSGVEKEQAFLQLEQLRANYDRDHEITVDKKKVSVPLTFSAGIASFPDDGTRAEDLMRKAFDALYRAKMGGRNKICLAREERMVTKTSHYTPGQLQRLTRLAKKEGIGEAALLREALDDLLMKYSV